MARIRERLAGARGREYWRSLEELAETAEFREYMEREFPRQAPRDWAPLSRRDFFRLMGATMALAGVGGCAYQPPENIVPYVQQPELIVPGKPLYYTTAFQRGGCALGLLAESHMGRPTKLEGNPEHPASRGATDPFAQASLLQLYDPDRSQSVRYLGAPATWDAFLGAVAEKLDLLRATGGAGLRIVAETVISPTLADQLRRLLAMYPEARLHLHDPVSRENPRAGTRMAFGQEAHPVYQFDRADRVLSLDADFLYEEPGSVRYARDFSDQRRVRSDRLAMNRLYVVESTPTLTGANADHRLTLKPSQIEPAARAIAAALGVSSAAGAAPPPGASPQWINALARDLKAHRGASLVIAGFHQPPAVHALAHAMNAALGALGSTITFTEPIEARFGAREATLRELVDDMRAGRVETLLILGSNPAYTAPADLAFAAAMQEKGPDGRERVPLRIHLGLYDDETGVLCHWHIPESHYLEAWSDTRTHDGTVTITQPLILPLYATRSAHELLAVFLREGDRDGYDIVREYWMRRHPELTGGPPAKPGVYRERTPMNGATEPAVDARAEAAGLMGGDQPSRAVPPTPKAQPPTPGPAAFPAFEKWWYEALIKGTVPGTAAAARAVALRPDFGAAAGGASSPAATGMEIIFRPDPTVWDGRFSNNGWLQELPKPLTTLTWDNAALVSPRTAEELKIGSGDVVELRYRGRVLPAAVWVMPGHPDGAATLHLGYGRTQAGRVGSGTGFNAYALRASDAPWFDSGLEIRKTAGRYHLVTAQTYLPMQSYRMHGREMVTRGTLAEYQAHPAQPEFMQEAEPLPSLYPQMWPSDRLTPTGNRGAAPHTLGDYAAVPSYNGLPVPQWGMVIDLTTCIGCNACTIACQAENNIATVGKGEVAKHRQMHWIRIDHYFVGPLEDPETLFQPVPCMQCEKAPCESVCPVEASIHDAEGINNQVYNRCIGTRYCSNNCPYKVRRFNFLQYSDQSTPTIQLMANPDVTVRSRGVMEKCTYCIQRITEARIQAEKEERPIRDGEVIPACAQVCPTEAIIFGNLSDRQSHNGQGSRVRRLKQEPHGYTLLPELNTRPRTSYLARVKNPNPEVGG